MPDRTTIGLDNKVFEGRLRSIAPTGYPRRFTNSSVRSTRLIQEVRTRPVHQPETPLQKFLNHERSPRSYSAPVPARPKLQQTAVLHRQSVSKPAPPSSEAFSAKSKNRAQTAVMTMAVTVFIVGLVVSILTLNTNKSSKAQVAALSQSIHQNSSNENNLPDESKPKDNSSYHVAPDLPKFIKIPSQSINARILPLGVTSNNTVQSPNNIFDAGWYNGSAKPGDAGTNGAILIDGHVHGPSLPGVFANLKKMKLGDSIQIQRGDNKIFTYKVVNVQSYDAKTFSLGPALTSAKAGTPGLNLITCGGKYNQSEGGYTQRVVVYAILQS